MAGEPTGARDDGRQVRQRLIDWIVAQKSIGQTLKNAVTNDVEGFGRRIDPVNDAGARAHTEVIRYGAPIVCIQFM